MKSLTLVICLLLCACGGEQEEVLVPCSPRAVMTQTASIVVPEDQLVAMVVDECGGSVKAEFYVMGEAMDAVALYCGTKGYESTNLLLAMDDFEKNLPARLSAECCPNGASEEEAEYCLACFNHQLLVNEPAGAVSKCSNR
jgi:hypothetical protein